MENPAYGKLFICEKISKIIDFYLFFHRYRRKMLEVQKLIFLFRNAKKKASGIISNFKVACNPPYYPPLTPEANDLLSPPIGFFIN